ncbi:MAG: DUF1127 domain-containing protein [Alphaproteobacteria bacterium]|nr:DUF1127 domain-containing protein [Alphaproteobacteria bacterium]
MTHIAEIRYHDGVAGTTGLRPSPGALLLQAGGLISLWYERSRQRRQLARLDDRLLRDIGVDRASAMEEVSKPFWRI